MSFPGCFPRAGPCGLGVSGSGTLGQVANDEATDLLPGENSLLTEHLAHSLHGTDILGTLQAPKI